MQVIGTRAEPAHTHGPSASPAVSTRWVELPGRGVTRVWECAGPPGAETIVLIHGVTFTAELNWGSVLEPLGRHFRVVALDQRGHGFGISPGSRFRLEDCADDIAALAGVLGIQRFVAVGYSMGGIVAQLLYRRHPWLLSGLVLCSTAGNLRESAVEHLAALTLPMVVAALAWNPAMWLLGAGAVGTVLLGNIEDPTTREWAHGQLRRTSLSTAVSAIHAVCEFASTEWIGQVEIPTAVIVTTRDLIVPASRQRRLASAVPGATSFDVEGGHGVCVNAPELFTPTLLQACRSVAARSGPVIPSAEDRDNGSRAVRPAATYPVPNANSRTWRSWIRRSRWRHGRSNPSKSAT